MRVGGHTDVLLLLIYIYITFTFTLHLNPILAVFPLIWVGFAKPARSLSFCCSICSKPLHLFSMLSTTRQSHLLLSHPVGLFIYLLILISSSRSLLCTLFLYGPAVFVISGLALFTDFQFHVFL
jgi:hypothetical protein